MKMTNEQMAMVEAWKASKPSLMDRAIGLSNSDTERLAGIYQIAWEAALRARFAYPAAKARGEIAVKNFITQHQPKITLT
jgi:hypothetical protein